MNKLQGLVGKTEATDPSKQTVYSKADPPEVSRNGCSQVDYSSTKVQSPGDYEVKNVSKTIRVYIPQGQPPYSSYYHFKIEPGMKVN